MKNVTHVTGSAVFGLMLVSAAGLRAQPSFPTFLTTETLNITLTALIQRDSGKDISQGNMTGTRDTITTVKITNKDIKGIIGAPLGAKLVLVNGTSLGYQLGLDVTDTGVPFIIQQGSGSAVDRGQDTSTTVGGDLSSRTVSKSNFTGNYIASISMDTSTNTPTATSVKAALTASDTLSLQLNGLATETQSSSTTESATTKTVSTHSLTVNASGEGTISGSPAVIFGTITTRGTETASD